MDVSTSEVVSDTDIIKQARELQYRQLGRSPFGRRWCKLSMVAIATLARIGLGSLETRILLYTLSSIRDGNLVDVNQSVIARELGSYSSNVSVALGNLVTANALERTDGAGGRFSVYRVSPHLAWWGSDNKAHMEACKTAPPLQQLPPKPKTASQKLAAAIPRIAAAARVPMKLETAGNLERRIERDDYAQD